ncbi:MAG: hypothetical protein J0L92_15610 [Deltaproteobacteria bacterium]|nr:hypothetical protein [Deltaproteobacteria bacterium]
MTLSGPSSTLVVALALLSVSACGGSQGGGATTTARSEGPPSGGSNDNIPPTTVATTSPGTGAATEVDTAGRGVDGQILVSGPGFAPPMLRASGVAGGPIEGHSGPMACTGSYPDRPQHVLKVGRRVPMLRVVADGIDRDLTLALRTPDGQWHCNDDSGDPNFGLNPGVDIPNAQGEIDVYVGVFSDSATGSQYTLGVTEDANRYGSSLRSGLGSAPPPMPGMPPGVVLP